VAMMNRRPDPSLGLFETLLIFAGEPVALQEHLARLGSSLGAVYGAELPEHAAELAGQAARGLELGRLRLTAVATPLHLGLDAEAAPLDPGLLLPSWDDGARLSSFELPGGLGTHKWRDRSLLPEETGRLPLILDRVGEVLEAARASVFAVRDGALFTPPLDGRILPGTTRSAVLALAAEVGIEVVERKIRREELGDADEVFLTGSVRGIEPARALDGIELGAGEVAPLLAERLAAHWALPATVR
jgi:para-aminobenzoate synthetase / 4-amino-4-deoxychorismate lyase